MSSNDIDEAYDVFKKINFKFSSELSEADTRNKFIDPVFKECLGWTEKNIRREPHIHSGFLDYIFSIEDSRQFVLEAKKEGKFFSIPNEYKRRRYKIKGTIWSHEPIRKAIKQAQEYAVNSGVRYAVISNGHQYIIFEAFKYGGNWDEGYCTVFRSLMDIEDNFTLFWNILSKESLSQGSMLKYISERKELLNFEKPYGFFNYEEQKKGQNYLARYIQPFINSIFGEITDDFQRDILKRCYVYQKQILDIRDKIEPRFDPLPHYSDKFGIEYFQENGTRAGEFQLSFEKCEKFLRREIPQGSLILLLGGIGSGKTTFIHHFFRILLEKRDDVLWFYIDFRQSSPDPERIEQYIYDKIVEDYEKKYETRFKAELESMGFSDPQPNLENILRLFSVLTYKSFTISVILDNVDQHSLKSPEYQEKVFLICQNLTDKFKTVTILSLREESFFKSTMSEVVNAYNLTSDIFHISSPKSEQVLRRRIDYILRLFDYDDSEISNILKERVNFDGSRNSIKTFFRILRRSIDQRRRQGQEIVQFIDDICGGDIRESLRFFSMFMTSGNTDLNEMFSIEKRENPFEEPWGIGYTVPYHHVVKSIMLKNSIYYSIDYSPVMNIFDVNPQYSNSHFNLLRILTYLNKKLNNYVSIGRGYSDIASLLLDADFIRLNKSAVEDSLKKLVDFGLIEFDNQSKSGLETAIYIRITRTGRYYLNRLLDEFAYLDLIWGDTPICDRNDVAVLQRSIRYNRIQDSLERVLKRFERTEIFLSYLKSREEIEWNESPELKDSLFNELYIDKICEGYFIGKKYILNSMKKRRELFGPPINARIMKSLLSTRYSFLTISN